MKKSLTLFLFCFTALYSHAQQTQIKGFFDSQLALVDSSSIGKKSHGFAIGELNLFITSQINDKTSFLAESVFAWDDDKQNFRIDVERVIIRYSVSNLLNLASGKFHTPFGYWSNAFHHGTLIQPTIVRPNIIRFEDEGGFLPIHQVGLQLDGSGFTNSNLGYNLFISNGQAQGNSGGDFKQTGSVAISGAVNAEPIPNLKLIVSAFSNNVPAGSVTYQGIRLQENSNYTMLNATIAYFYGDLPIEFNAEYYSITNTMNVSGTSKLNGFFGYIGLKKFKLKPYLVYNSIQYQQNQSEQYFIKNNLTGFTAGLRYNIDPKAVVKLEYTNEKTDLTNTQKILRLQVAIGF